MQGPSPGRFDYWHLSGRPTGRCRRRGCMKGCAESAGGPAGAGTGLVGWSRVARTGRLPERIVRVWGSRQRDELGGSLSWRLMPMELSWMVACRSAVSESGHSVSKVCWTGAGSAQAGPRAREGPGCAGRRGPGRGPLNPVWVGVGRHDRRSWRGLKFGRFEMGELEEVCLVGEVLQTCPPEFAEWSWLILWPRVENS